MHCGICDGTTFTTQQVLWKQLVADWQLSPAEADYINRQQGQFCTQCGANLRSIALANAIRAFFRTDKLLQELPGLPEFADARILEINDAGMLTPILRQFRHHVHGTYPEMDIHALPCADQAFDLVLHSDTLEHVENPIHALSECRRVLRPRGALCFTVPMVVGRMSRNRVGLPRSYHGNPATGSEDYAVQTEFGADAWTYVMEAGFTEVALHAVAYPSGVAFLARR